MLLPGNEGVVSFLLFYCRSKRGTPMPYMDPEERNTLVDMVAQAVMDKMEERERTNALADLVVARVLEMQNQKASLQAKSSPDGPTADQEIIHT